MAANGREGRKWAVREVAEAMLGHIRRNERDRLDRGDLGGPLVWGMDNLKSV